MTAPNPNFPLNLDIHPSTNSIANAADANFGSVAQEMAIRQYDIAGRVWEAAYAMMSYIRPAGNLIFDPPIFDPMMSNERHVIIELGSGSGLVASTIASMLKPGRDRFIATDLPEVCSTFSCPALELRYRKRSALCSRATYKQ